MDIDLIPGTYVVAVSGGVDSRVLLELLYQKKKEKADKSWHFVIAHFDHGIREDSSEDRKLVQRTARNMGVPFVYNEASLGLAASEAIARTRRYEFLRKVKSSSGARAIITAHHQDDLLETAIINMIRGTGRKGLTALSSGSEIVRPLLNVPKSELIAYAKEKNLSWREDSTNQNQAYVRNYIRHSILTRFDDPSKIRLLEILTNLRSINSEIDILLINQLHIQSVGGMIDRRWFNHLPHIVAKETIACWLRAHGESNFNSRTLERLVVAAKVGHPGDVFPLSKEHALRIGRLRLALSVLER
jgi:tRNA(Ile)-lysidine synthetase-like protein